MTNNEMPNDVPTSFQEALAGMHVTLENAEVQQLAAFLDRLLTANQSFNLTAITNRDEAWLRHIANSLTLLPYLVEAGAKNVLDVGSGGGLPGIPLAIALPNVHFTLLEATGKKAHFLEQTAREMQLDNVTVKNSRAETLAHDDAHREHYDIVTARAVGKLNVLLELTLPFATIGGLVLAIKGQQAPDEVHLAKAALHQLHANVVETIKVEGGTLVLVEKRRATPKRYPRRPGEPARAPL
ncbi:MAG: 16S rRNA (guanine(527)-N(7))-methyltransferase RsmG [Phycisphaerales bacterium]